MCVCVCVSAVENGSGSVWSEWEHRAVRVGLPSVGTQRSHSLEDNAHIQGLLKDAYTHTEIAPGDKDAFRYLSDSCPVLQDVQVRQHVNNIWA